MWKTCYKYKNQLSIRQTYISSIVLMLFTVSTLKSKKTSCYSITDLLPELNLLNMLRLRSVHIAWITAWKLLLTITSSPSCLGYWIQLDYKLAEVSWYYRRNICQLSSPKQTCLPYNEAVSVTLTRGHWCTSGRREERELNEAFYLHSVQSFIFPHQACQTKHNLLQAYRLRNQFVGEMCLLWFSMTRKLKKDLSGLL